MDPLIELLTHRPLVHLADAMRSRVEQITRLWDAALRKALPELDCLTYDELKDSVPIILQTIADALASDNPNRIDGLVAQAPMQGLTRFHQKYGPTQVMQEDRLLRAIIVIQCEEALGRQLDQVEAAALQAAVDVMIQRSVMALVDKQQVELTLASERELKFLAFLSHDMNNNLGGVTLLLRVLRDELKGVQVTKTTLGHLDAAENAIFQTIAGMRRLLEHERLQKGEVGPKLQAIEAQGYLDSLAHEMASEAAAKGLKLNVTVDPNFEMSTDPELVSLVLRNLIGNSIKFTTGTTVSLRGVKHPTHAPYGWSLEVGDTGPGIRDEDKQRIFKAFRRGSAFGQEGIGLGLAVATTAAKLLGARLSVESALGTGSTFTLRLPRPRAGD